ncbi:aldehyde dehydrogenase family protein [Hansschlegelia plantiphila]|uniref:Aldehyde dehydrogenase n=1 Tax=Hansschlegelia plantiphila TaxID=374655 RepID=A0A9W6J3N8_9HYPH|nr:aldehyde dehydrogenase family protein [Hansschlegelia plantiphila]GLK69742.1 aldehyde dehydrogenase [Hansschlegelia plantiphila]
MNIAVKPDLLGNEARAQLARKSQLLIGGRFVDAADASTFETFDPATGRKIADVAKAGAADVDAAVKSAQLALVGPWSKLAPAERERLIRKLADLIEARMDMIAQVESLDSGKPVEYIKFVDVGLSVGAMRYAAGWPTKIEGDTLPVGAPNMLAYTRREPVGVVGAIVPWNFPLCQACFKLAPALAAGCTVIIKPAEQTPLSALILGELALEAGIPEGVVNVVTGYGDVGQALVDHPGVSKISFTGSEEVGKLVAARGAATLKHVSLELGGKNPNIIFADSDVDAAAATAAMAIFFYTGQICSAGSRVMVERPVYDRVCAVIQAEAGKLKIGHGLSSDTTLGPLISAEQFARVSGFVERSRDSGVEATTGGAKPGGELEAGHFFLPTVLTGATDDVEVVRQEIFGPVVVVQPFDEVDELVDRANASNFGLAAGVWTQDVRKAHAVAAALKAGTVWINTYNQFDAAAPWGGFKSSGYGRDNGREGVEKYLQTKTVWTNYA